MKNTITSVCLLMLSAAAMAKGNRALERASAEAGDRSRVARAEVVADRILLVDDPHAAEFGRPDASYVAIHFKSVKLRSKDTLTVQTPDGTTRTVTYVVSTLPTRGFWAVSMPGSRALIRLNDKSGQASYEVDQLAVGLDTATVVNLNQSGFVPQEICGDDDSKESRCYDATHHVAYQKARAVARLLIHGRFACTGWLVGPDGYLFTNEHCVKDATDAAAMQVEFMAEGANCNVNCNAPFACPGEVVAAPGQSPVTFVTANRKYDYALVKLKKSVAGRFGFLTLRAAGPTLNEPVYIPQHPRGVGKRLVIVSSQIEDQPSGLAHINTVTASACDGGTQKEVGYQADTDPGASGSAVISAVDNRVVALHHCGGCPNHGVPIDSIIRHLGNRVPPGAVQ